MEFALDDDANNPYDEVKKLKFLVKQLEKQNKQLLKNTNSASKPTRSLSLHESSGLPKKHYQGESCKCIPKERNNVPEVIPEITSKSQPSNNNISETLNHLVDDILDLEDLELSDEEDSWLYSSPVQSKEDSLISPYEWLRKDLDDLENTQLQMAKGALSSKLNELAILTPQRTKIQAVPQENGKKEEEKENGDEDSESHTEENESPSLRLLNTRTFTRRKKSLPELPPIINRRPADRDEVFTIHELARQQEESLRLDSTTTPRRSIVPQRPTNLVYWSSNSDIEGAHDLRQLPSASSSNLLAGRKNGRPTAPPTSSVHSSPIQGAAPLLRCRQSKQGQDFHRSMPNLNRIPKGGTGKLSSRTFKVANRSPQPAPAQSPAGPMARRVNSPSTNHHHNSRMVTHHPSGLPRPSKLSLPTPPGKRSGIPGPKHHQDGDLWSDGCY